MPEGHMRGARNAWANYLRKQGRPVRMKLECCNSKTDEHIAACKVLGAIEGIALRALEESYQYIVTRSGGLWEFSSKQLKCKIVSTLGHMLVVNPLASPNLTPLSSITFRSPFQKWGL
ncbi:hypothetical protein N657DRAFT_720892 [Parathielavia appendiculata]|uniref:Uncharacterized protein n=1 Tax=Parathielavia appendiculata TaxID=2587402 RepID=A0AAN6TX77_9PEZI|nr:hypothetical protein N657DRAFT_720892 [Parathielavia appendiculata]